MNAQPIVSRHVLWRILNQVNRRSAFRIAFSLLPSASIIAIAAMTGRSIILGPLLVLGMLLLVCCDIARKPMSPMPIPKWPVSTARVAVIITLSIIVLAVLPAPEGNLYAVLHDLVLSTRVQATFASLVCMTLAAPVISHRFWGISPGFLPTLFRASSVVSGYLGSLALTRFTGNGYTLSAVGDWLETQPLNGIDWFFGAMLLWVTWYFVKAIVSVMRKPKEQQQ